MGELASYSMVITNERLHTGVVMDSETRQVPKECEAEWRTLDIKECRAAALRV